MNIEFVGFLIGIVGAIWMKCSMNLLHQRNKQPEMEKMLGRQPEDPALRAFIRGISLVLIGLGLETIARLFLR